MLAVGDRVRVRHTTTGGFTYTFHVEVREICVANRFLGHVENIFAEGNGEVTGGDILRLKGEEIKFDNSALVVQE